MNTIQLVVAIAGFVSLLAAVIAGAWINQRAIERQMTSFERQFDSFRQEIKAELRAEIGTLRSDLKAETGTLRAEMHALNEKVDRIDQVFQRLYQPVLPGKGD
jgi:hypothetical protein